MGRAADDDRNVRHGAPAECGARTGKLIPDDIAHRLRRAVLHDEEPRARDDSFKKRVCCAHICRRYDIRREAQEIVHGVMDAHVPRIHAVSPAEIGDVLLDRRLVVEVIRDEIVDGAEDAVAVEILEAFGIHDAAVAVEVGAPTFEEVGVREDELVADPLPRPYLRKDPCIARWPARLHETCISRMSYKFQGKM